jgi:hypothetical protein
LATSKTGTIFTTNPHQFQSAGTEYPVSQFIFDTPIEVITGTKYVVGWVIGNGVVVYVKIIDEFEENYVGGQPIECNGSLTYTVYLMK